MRRDEHESKTEDEILVMQRRLEVEDVFPGHPLPTRPTRRLDHRSQALREQRPAFALESIFSILYSDCAKK